jgi:phosphoenolpyruvate carboxylase
MCSLLLPVQVQRCYELAGEYGSSEGHQDAEKLEDLAVILNSFDAGNSIVVSSSFSHMLNLGNLAEEVQIACRRRIKTKSGDINDENCALTESDIDETFRRLVYDLQKSPKEIFEALKSQTVDLVLTAHPTQSVRRSLLQKHGRLERAVALLYSIIDIFYKLGFFSISNLLSWYHICSIRTCLSELYAPGITPDEKRELDEALQREVYCIGHFNFYYSWILMFMPRLCIS